MRESHVDDNVVEEEEEEEEDEGEESQSRDLESTESTNPVVRSTSQQHHSVGPNVEKYTTGDTVNSSSKYSQLLQ